MYPSPVFCCGANFHDEEKTHVAAANELQATFGGNKEAERSWRAAVADHLIESLGTSSKAGIANDIDAVSLDKLARHSERTSRR